MWLEGGKGNYCSRGINVHRAYVVLLQQTYCGPIFIIVTNEGGARACKKKIAFTGPTLRLSLFQLFDPHNYAEDKHTRAHYTCIIKLPSHQ